MAENKEVVLTPELYSNLMNIIKDQTIGLKESQVENSENISFTKEELKELRKQLCEIKQNILEKEKELASQKKSLRKTNRALRIRKKMTNSLIVNFSSSKQKTLKLGNFQKKLGI